MADAIKPLRPALTRALAARLLDGASINLTAPHGLGRRRTLQDLRSVLPPVTRVLHADLKFCADNFPATFQDLCNQAGTPNTNIRHLGHLIEALAKRSESTLLVLHNFDLLRPDKLQNQPHDPLFDTALLPYLAGFRNHRNLALLVVCEDIYPDWPLPCEHLPLPPLQHS